jgi:hypothetical protein
MPTPGPQVYDEDSSTMVYGAAVADPSGGATVDTQARAAIVAILAALRAAGIIAQD